MPDKVHDVLLKLIAILVGIGALYVFVTGIGDGGVFGKVFVLFGALFLLATALGFARYRGWAFLVVSAGLLIGWMTAFVKMIVGFDRGGWDAGRGYLLTLVGIILLIAYLGRWKMERRFRPHLDTDHSA